MAWTLETNVNEGYPTYKHPVANPGADCALSGRYVDDSARCE